MRRLLRESFRALRAAWPGLDLVVSCSRPWPGAGMADVAEELAALVATTLGKRG
jgi:RNase P protein component